MHKIKILKLFIFLIVISIIVVLSLAGCNKEALPVEGPEETKEEKKELENYSSKDNYLNITSITVDEAYEIFNSNKNYIFIDVRTVDEYESNHIKSAINIPVSKIEDRISEIPRDKQIIVYCDGSSCERSGKAAEILVNAGFEEVYDMSGGGIYEWDYKDYPVVKKQ